MLGVRERETEREVRGLGRKRKKAGAALTQKLQPAKVARSISHLGHHLQIELNSQQILLSFVVICVRSVFSAEMIFSYLSVSTS